MRVANEALELSTALFAALTKLSLSGRIQYTPLTSFALLSHLYLSLLVRTYSFFSPFWCLLTLKHFLLSPLYISQQEEAMRLTVAKCVVALQNATLSIPPATSRVTTGQDMPSPQVSALARVAHAVQPMSTGKYVVGMGNMVLQDEIRSVLTKLTKSSASPNVTTKTISKEESVLGGLKISFYLLSYHFIFLNFM